MTFSREQWQAAIDEKLSSIGDWLRRRRDQDAPYLAYGLLSGLSIWPLVEAAAQTGQATSVIMALGGVAGGVGGNLIAEQVQRWAARADELTEQDVVSWASERAAKDEELREALDSILDELEVITQAEQHLSDDDREWFTETLHRELKQLGNVQRFQAQLEGSGAVAQAGDRAAAATDRGMAIAGDVDDSVFMTGDENAYFGSVETITIESAIFQTPPEPGRVAPKHLLWSYLNQVVFDAATLDLSGIDRKMASDFDEAQLDLAAVYTSLDTVRSKDVEREKDSATAERALMADLGERERQSALGFVDKYQYSALLGDPGSGKTTFAKD